MKKYKCVPISDVSDVSPQDDDYAFFHSSAFQSIFGKKKRESDIYTGAGCLKVSRGNKSLYLKYSGKSKVTGDRVMLSYANRGLLSNDQEQSKDSKQQDEFEVTVSRVSWFAYNWNNRNLNERWNFRAAVIGFAALLILDIPQFIITVIQLFK